MGIFPTLFSWSVLSFSNKVESPVKKCLDLIGLWPFLRGIILMERPKLTLDCTIPRQVQLSVSQRASWKAALIHGFYFRACVISCSVLSPSWIMTRKYKMK